jgi:hypothetical protein
MAPGRELFWSVTLRPGRYFMLCGVREGTKLHAELGMIHEFAVP